MNPFRDLLEDLGSLSRQQVVLRAVIMVGLLGFAVMLLAAGDSSTYALIVLSVLGALCVVNPHTVIPAAVIIYCMAVWWAGVPDPFNPLVVPAALCLLLVHTACALSAATPAQADISTSLLGEYAVRLAIVSGATVLLSLVAWGQQEWGYRGGVTAVIAGLLALGVAVGLHYWVVTVREDD